jgi:hypothetical protein
MSDIPFSPRITLSHALTSPTLFGPVFAKATFWTWRVVAKIIDGEPLTEPRELELFQQCTGRTQLPNRQERRRLRRYVLLVGRRGGKDRFESAVAVWRAALCADWRQHTSAGEQSVVLLLGKDKKPAAILRKYCTGLLAIPALAREVTRQTTDVIEFRNGSTLEIVSNDAGLVRGRSAIAVIGSESCFWKSGEHAASSDEEVIAGAEPSMSMCPDGGLLLMGSSVYRQRGWMYRKFKELHGNDESEDICWFAPSRTMNPSLPQSVVDQAIAEDPLRFGAEYNSTWREDLSECYPLDAVENSTDWKVYERARQPGIMYVAFFDAATGTGGDAFTFCIVHCPYNDNVVTVDVLRERKPRFVAAEVIKEFAILLKSYGCYECSGDKFGGGLVSDEWLRNGIRFKESEYTTSENYLRALPMIMSGRARLLDNAQLRHQLTSLERSVTLSGHEIVRHPQISSSHDDLATSLCGALVIAGDRGHGNSFLVTDTYQSPQTEEEKRAEAARNAEWRAARNTRGIMQEAMGLNSDNSMHATMQRWGRNFQWK